MSGDKMRHLFAQVGDRVITPEGQEGVVVKRNNEYLNDCLVKISEEDNALLSKYELEII